jgi:hypothetical protein
MKRIIRLWAVAAVMAAMLAMSGSPALSVQLPQESCTGITTAQENASYPLDKAPEAPPFSSFVKCDV